jgi:hypothetical protein
MDFAFFDGGGLITLDSSAARNASERVSHCTQQVVARAFTGRFVFTIMFDAR